MSREPQIGAMPLLSSFYMGEELQDDTILLDRSQIGDDLAKIMADFCKMWEELQQSISSALGKVDFDAVIAGIDRHFQEAFASAEKIGSCGWTLPLDIAFFQIDELIAAYDALTIDTYFLKHYGDSDLADIERRGLRLSEFQSFHPVLKQCFAAYRRGDYAITTTALTALFESAVRNLIQREDFYTRRLEARVADRCRELQQQNQDSVVTFLWVSVWSFMKWLYTPYDDRQSGEKRIYRHGLQHGTQAPSNDRIESLRLFHALNTVTSFISSRFPGRESGALARETEPTGFR